MEDRTGRKVFCNAMVEFAEDKTYYITFYDGSDWNRRRTYDVPIETDYLAVDDIVETVEKVGRDVRSVPMAGENPDWNAIGVRFPSNHGTLAVSVADNGIVRLSFDGRTSKIHVIDLENLVNGHQRFMAHIDAKEGDGNEV